MIDLANLKMRLISRDERKIELLTNAVEPVHCYVTRNMVELGVPRIRTLLKNSAKHWRIEHEDDVFELVGYESTLDLNVLNAMLPAELEMTLEGCFKALAYPRRLTTARSRIFLRRVLESVSKTTGLNVYPEVTSATPFRRPQFTGNRPFIYAMQKNASFNEGLYEILDEFWPTGWKINYEGSWAIEASETSYESIEDRMNNPYKRSVRSKRPAELKTTRLGKAYADVLDGALFKELDSAHSTAHMVALLEKIRAHATMLPILKNTLISNRHLHRPGGLPR